MWVRTMMREGRSRLAPGVRQGPVDRFQVVAVRHALHVPAVRLEPLAALLGEGEVGCRGKGDAVVVIEADQLAEPQMAGERGRLRRHTLHQVAVAGDDIGEMVDDIEAGAVVAGRQMGLGDRHPDAVGETLAEGAGGHLDPRRLPRSGWPGVLLPHWRKRLISSRGRS